MSSSSQALDPLLGTLVAGRYRVTGVLGHGGMGVVYAGVQEGLDRQVAIKILRPGKSWGDDPSARERFSREAQAAGALAHPHIVTVHDLGMLPDGRPYFVMEHLVGENFCDLRQRLGTLSPMVVADLLKPAASALDALHAIGIIHRDVKPENLVLSLSPDGRAVVKLVDFGLVAISDRSRLTRKGLIVGTPEFVAPECLLEDTLPDGRADVYSLAVVAFELLTGALPFDAPPVGPLLAAKLRTKPRPLSVAAGGAHFAPELEMVIAKGLARKPADRYATAGLFMNAFTQAADEAARDPATPVAVSEAVTAVTAVAPSKSGENVWTYDRATVEVERGVLSSSMDIPGASRWRDPFVLAGVGLVAVTAIACAVILILHFAKG